jgi:GntR family transcriptional regulator, carbon starvation induced regulator
MMLRVNDNLASDAEGPRNQTTIAYEALRADILNGRHVPGKKLKIQELAEDFGVSPGAVREALSRLVPEELVVSRDQRGFLVAPLSLADLADLTDLRCEIESLALRRSVALGDVNWEAGILAAEHRLRSKAAVVDGEDPLLKWRQNHAAFHAAVVNACGSRRLIGLHSQLYEQSERYRGLSSLVDTGRDVAGEHHLIVEFALARDADALVNAMVDHLRATQRLIVDAFGRTASAG